MDYALIGHGRMGCAIDAAARERGHRRRAVLDDPDSQDELDAARLDGARVAFEFTVPQAAERNVVRLLDAGLRVVCGTTGWVPSPQMLERAEGSAGALIVAPNFSIGVNLFLRIVKQAAETLGALGLQDPFVQEWHHRGKIDAPSGTARRIAAIVQEADPRIESVVEGHPDGALAAGALQVVATRGGVEPGTHRVGWDGPHELITLEHRARGRDGFALGAVLAGEWLEDRCGVHRFDDVLDAVLRGEMPREGPSPPLTWSPWPASLLAA